MKKFHSLFERNSFCINNTVSHTNMKKKELVISCLSIFLTIDNIINFAKMQDLANNQAKFYMMVFLMIFLTLLDLFYISSSRLKNMKNRKFFAFFYKDIAIYFIKTILIFFEGELRTLLNSEDKYEILGEDFKLFFIEICFQKTFSDVSFKILSLLSHGLYVVFRLISIENFSLKTIKLLCLYFCWFLVAFLDFPVRNKKIPNLSFLNKSRDLIKNVKSRKHSSFSPSPSTKIFEKIKENNFDLDFLMSNINDCCLIINEKNEIKYSNRATNFYFPDLNEESEIKFKENKRNSSKDLSANLEIQSKSNIESKKKYIIKEIFEQIRTMKENYEENQANDLIDEKWMTLKEVFEIVPSKNNLNLESNEIHSNLNVIDPTPKLRKKIKKFSFLNGKVFQIILYIDTISKNNDILCIFKDISSSKNIKKLIMINENKAKTISFVSHEIRTPLNCIINMLKIVENKIDEEIYDKIIKPAENSAEFLLNLVNDLLDMAQIEAGKFKLNYIEFDLKMLLSDIITLIKIQAESRKIELELRYNSKLPEAIKSDPNRIRQIIINLLGNALKFTTKGRIKITAKLEKKSRKLIRISVKDSGIGINEKDQKKLFKAFGKLDLGDNETLNIQGVGLGLLISNILAKNLGPEDYNYDGLQVKSKLEHGTKFFFIIEDKNEENYRECETDRNEKMLGEKMNALHGKFKFDGIIKKPTKVNSSYEDKCLFDKEKKNKSLNIKNRSLLKIENFLVNNEKVSNIIDFDHEKFMTQSDNLGVNKSKKNIVQNNFLNMFFLDKKLMKKTQFISEIFCNQNRNSKSLKSLVNFKEIEGVFETIIQQNQNKKCSCFDILIADDNDFNILALKYHLEEFKFRVEACFSGQEAIDKVKNLWADNECCRKYQLIFMDVEMPVKNGIQATFEIIEFFADKFEKQIIVGCTGYSSEKEKNECLKSGMKSVMTKPISKGVLMNILTKNIEVQSNLKREISIEKLSSPTKSLFFGKEIIQLKKEF